MSPTAFTAAVNRAPAISLLHPSEISVIIPVYNGGDSFRRCLASLEQFVPPTVEVIVVIDGGSDACEQAARSFGAKVIRLDRNQGPAYARNVGAQAARGDLLFFMDADVAIHWDTLTQIALAFEANPALDALIGSYDDTPGAVNFLSQYKNLLHHYTHQVSREEASTFWGACGAIRKSVFFDVGGFDEAYRYPSIEDIELGYRLRHHHYHIGLCKQVQVTHLKRWGVRSLLKADFFYRAVPWTELIWRDRMLVNDLNLDTNSRLSVIAVYSLAVFITCIPFSLWAVNGVIVCSLVLLLLNASVYRFFLHKRSLTFTLQVIPWHWLYYAYSGIAFVLGTVKYWMQSGSGADRSQRVMLAQPLAQPMSSLVAQKR
ncbi:glycosyltransferase family 2 protein [Alkalinema pantanalense CENA528]|uniref:glycosyltransferase family 2 protein n=1 Tax=Alkalinema pantanalense TaxID=1620705 RepID=UPI003D6E4E69